MKLASSETPKDKFRQPRMEKIGGKLCVRTVYTEQRAGLNGEQTQTLDKKLLRILSSSNDLCRLIEVLQEGADPNAKDRSLNHTALMVAARKGKADFAGALLDFGADPYLRGHGNTTAYEVAKTWGQLAVIELFMKRGIDYIPR